MDNGEGTDYGSGGGPGRGEQRGEKWDNINNKLFFKERNQTLCLFLYL